MDAVRPSACAAGLLALLAAATEPSTGALAEPLERNLPPVRQAPSSTVTAPPPPIVASDATSIGIVLRGVLLLGATTVPSRSPTTKGIDAALVPRINQPGPRRVLAKYIGRPISRRLISEIEATIVREFRREGHPFVQVSTPEQELTEGVLQIRVVEFKVGRRTIVGTAPPDTAYLETRIRLGQGDHIDAPSLGQDLDWLNRFPARVVSASFTPGAALGESDLQLTVKPLRNWSLSAGYATSGSPATDENRYFVAASLAGHVLTDEFASVQVTGSPDFWSAGGRLFGQVHPAYASAAGRLVVSTAPRQDAEFTFDAVETNEPVQAFVSRQDTVEATLAYRSAVSNLIDAPGDAAVGLEVSRQMRRTFFRNVAVVSGAVDVWQIFADWSGSLSDRLGVATIDASLHVSPGDVDGRNSDASFATFTDARVHSSAYAYGAFDVSRRTQLPFGMVLYSDFAGQLADSPLPDSQQIAIGGPAAVRGYTLDDGAWDSGLYVRNELRMRELRLVSSPLPAASLAPFVFADAGYAQDDHMRARTHMASLGGGVEFDAGRGLAASLDIAQPLVAATITHPGSSRVDARVSYSF